MDQFRFSPIKDKTTLFSAIEYLHFAAHKLCKLKLGYYLPVCGNVGIFSHFEDEFERLIELRKELTDINVSWNQKYFKLYKPIIFPAKDGLPETTYTLLYIRKPMVTHPQVGDIDFYVDPKKYQKMKQEVKKVYFPKGVRLLERPDLDLIELLDPSFDVAVYIGCYDFKKIIEGI